MDAIIISKSALKDISGNAIAGEESPGGALRYTLGTGYTDAEVCKIAFGALIRSIVERRLRCEGHALCGDEGIVRTFEQKLSEHMRFAGLGDKIETIIETLLNETGVLDIEGIILFRLKEFMADISAFFDLHFYEESIRRKHDGFICLLRDYVLLESPVMEAVHIIFRGNGFTLCNAGKEDITYAALKHYNDDSNFREGNLNDFLISSLIHYLPKRIIIHKGNISPGKRRIADTICLIFRERVVICDGCDCEFCGYSQPFGEVSYSAYDDTNI